MRNSDVLNPSVRTVAAEEVAPIQKVPDGTNYGKAFSWGFIGLVGLSLTFTLIYRNFFGRRIRAIFRDDNDCVCDKRMDCEPWSGCAKFHQSRWNLFSGVACAVGGSASSMRFAACTVNRHGEPNLSSTEDEVIRFKNACFFHLSASVSNDCVEGHGSGLEQEFQRFQPFPFADRPLSGGRALIIEVAPTIDPKDSPTLIVNRRTCTVVPDDQIGFAPPLDAAQHVESVCWDRMNHVHSSIPQMH